MQLAVKQLSPGVKVRPCTSTVLQFGVEEIGQLVPLLPNPCSPISSSRWQTKDLDGNKVLFQVRAVANVLILGGNRETCFCSYLKCVIFTSRSTIMFYSNGGMT